MGSVVMMIEDARETSRTRGEEIDQQSIAVKYNPFFQVVVVVSVVHPPVKSSIRQ